MKAKSLNPKPTSFKFEVELTSDELKYLESLLNAPESDIRSIGVWFPAENDGNVGMATWSCVSGMLESVGVEPERKVGEW